VKYDVLLFVAIAFALAVDPALDLLIVRRKRDK
jgi:hypothetical protein